MSPESSAVDGLYSRLSGHSLYSSNSIMKFANGMVVLGLISKSVYMEEIIRLTKQCQDNYFQLTMSKMKELILDFSRKQECSYTTLYMNGSPVERVRQLQILHL